MGRRGIGLLTVCSGAAALSWEVLWQHCASLFLGASALGAAITLSVMMLGLSGGAFLGGRYFDRWPTVRPLRIYAALEAVIGLAGLALLPAFEVLGSVDRWLFQTAPAAVPAGHALGLLVILGVPALAMGATIPALRLVATAAGASLSRLYALNTLGAAIGTLGFAFFVVAALGISATAQLAAFVNLLVALVAYLATAQPAATPVPAVAGGAQLDLRVLSGVAFVTGFATFALEVVWFRAMRSAFLSEMDAFAIMLCTVLVPLAASAALARWLAQRGWTIATVLAGAGVAVLLGMPLVERFDVITVYPFNYALRLLAWFGTGLAVVGPAVLLLGLPLPMLLDRADGAQASGRLYAVNTVAAAAGALGAAWLLLPNIGLAKTGWLIGTGLMAVAIALASGTRRRQLIAGVGAVVLAGVIALKSDVGTLHVRGPLREDKVPVLAYHEGPDVTAAVIEPPDGARILVIDGFVASSERGLAEYMEWMGRLPMLLHPDPKRALVICYGTGQTANAVRNEQPEALDIVELSADVLKMAPLFTRAEGVLTDPRVQPIVMDGRAWLRRTDRKYDVVTLEPMPPNFAGVNALYSLEFYELVAQRLNPGGVVAQWLPYHLVTPPDAAAIAATFREVFPDAVLWHAPVSKTGILLGRVPGSPTPLGTDWPGFARPDHKRTLTPEVVKAGVVLGVDALARYSAEGVVVTDDNQQLAYSRTRAVKHQFGYLLNTTNLQRVDQFARVKKPQAP